MRHRLLALLLLLPAGAPLAAEPAPGAPEPADAPPDLRLTVDLPVAVATTGGLLLLSGLSVLLKPRLAAPACRWCEPGPVDRWARSELLWSNPSRAAVDSDLLQVALPVGAALTLVLMAHQDGAGGREVAEDLLVVTEAVAVATALTQAAKYAAARPRPDAWARGGPSATAAGVSFWSGHAAFSFSVAAGATQVARLRGRSGWRWLALASFAGAAATGWLRVAGDQHWLTDWAAGALVGTASGLGVPLLVLRPADAGGHRPAVALVPAPGGLAIVF